MLNVFQEPFPPAPENRARDSGTQGPTEKHLGSSFSRGLALGQGSSLSVQAQRMSIPTQQTHHLH